MTSTQFDPERLKRTGYDLSDPLAAARFQRTAFDFMELVRSNAFRHSGGDHLLDQFCTFVSSTHVWGLAQMVVPEFRSALPGLAEHEEPTCLDYVLQRLPLLPAPQHKNVLTAEQEMLQQRHRTWVEYLVTGGEGKSAATPDQLAQAQQLSEQVDIMFQLDRRRKSEE